MLMNAFSRLTLLMFAACMSAAPTIAKQPVAKDDPVIMASAAEIRAHMSVLADDLLEGRESGTRGDELARLYISTRFSAIGLKPAGDNGTFVQKFSIRATRLVPDSVSFIFTSPKNKSVFENGPHIAVFGDPEEADQNIEAELVFVGYGIVAPEFGINDYANIDVQGKVAVVIGGPPAFLPAAEAAHYGSTDQQHLTAENFGAIGVIHLWTPALETRFPWAGMVGQTKRTDVVWRAPNGKPNIIAPGVRLRAFTNGDATSALLEGSGKTMDDLIDEGKTASPKSFPLHGQLTFIRKSDHEDRLITANIAGLLSGSDPELRKEVVVLTAHYDHIGIGDPVDGDSIYNGALDNASGTAGLIEVARQLVISKMRPKRSILFLAVGAEEKGLIGSDYFAEYPTVRRNDIIANINLDGLNPFYDFSDIIAFGAEQSQMGERLKSAADELGLEVGPDPFPEEGIFTRSDQYSFVKRGIPSIFLYPGFTDMNGKSVGLKFWKESPIHLPNEDLSQPIDYAVVAKFIDLFRRLTLATANNTDRPLWYDDSTFGKQFAPDRSKVKRVRK